ncbi:MULTISPECIES: DUF2280 domain-containing protein [Pseudomonas syringae group]|uniref:DUF2280 domain-containing protein n=1 Tax=Pseudomonas syringae pv. ribicola TaxID=55398 RepID=A0A3M2VMQ1_PSESI|nr:DUF2280 domain-containing protein [Pseudomonas syringae group genomosp. 3]RML40551.1 hypothetical protein ALQ95_01088 [Pseudomonas syringae pv. ribicola]
MAVLRSEVKAFVVQALACFDTPSQVVAAVKTEFGIEITRQQCESHDPTKFAGQRLGKNWAELFHSARKRFREETTDIPIANRGSLIQALDEKLLVLQNELFVSEGGMATANNAEPLIGDLIGGKRVLNVGHDPAGATWTVQLRK